MGVDELTALGLYDPASPDAETRLALLELALAHGATVEDIRDAIDAGHLHVLAAECVMRGELQRFTLAELAQNAGVTEADALTVWRAWGFPEPPAGTQSFTEEDVQAVIMLRGLADVAGRDAAVSFARTVGGTSLRLAEALVSLLRSRIELSLVEHGSSRLDLANTFVILAREFLPRLTRQVGTVLRHHIEVVGRRYSMAGEPANSANSVRLVVGFADIVGYTALSGTLLPDELSKLMQRFEAESAECITRGGATLVKRIGDAVMFVTPHLEAAARVALDLIEVEKDRLETHVGIAAGEVVARDGDFYGPPVNLASRLSDVAPPGSVLVPTELTPQLESSGFSVEPLGVRALAGIAAPVNVGALRRSI